MLDRRPERDDREHQQRAEHRDHRRDDVDQLVGRLDRHVLLDQELHGVGERLEQAERAVHVGAGTHLHAADDLALEPDREQHADQQEHDDGDGLDQPDPPRVVAEVGCRPGATAATRQERHARASTVWRGRPDRCQAHHGRPRRRAGRRGHRRRPAIRRQPDHVVRHVGERPRAASSVPASVRHARGCRRPARRRAAAVPAEMRATGRLAVPARNGSPDCRRPASSSWCQVASTAVPGGDRRRLGGRHVGGADAGAVPAAQLVELGVHRVERLQPELDARARRRAGRARGGRPSRARSAPAGTGAGAPPT